HTPVRVSEVSGLTAECDEIPRGREWDGRWSQLDQLPDSGCLITGYSDSSCSASSSSSWGNAGGRGVRPRTDATTPADRRCDTAKIGREDVRSQSGDWRFRFLEPLRGAGRRGRRPSLALCGYDAGAWLFAFGTVS